MFVYRRSGAGVQVYSLPPLLLLTQVGGFQGLEGESGSSWGQGGRYLTAQPGSEQLLRRPPGPPDAQAVLSLSITRFAFPVFHSGAQLGTCTRV